uniref:Lamin tail domain-containing protein n=1 Tax=Eiseniibacteriota bacterium TaxID=2212470 RepID=A0A832MLZ5_UNCEI
MKLVKGPLAALLALGLVAGVASAQPQLNEIRVDQSGTDVDEYVEFAGAPGASLAGHHLLVIGDTGSSGTCGVLEAVINLGAYSIQADGYFALRYSSGTPLLTGYDATLAGSFENSDNLTFLLVTGYSGPAVGGDLDTNDDGVLDSTPWTTLVDAVGIWEGTTPNCTTDEYLYTSTVVGPDGTFAPGHVYRCGNAWYIGPFDPAGGVDSPGAQNAACATPAKSSTWGKVKTLYR